MTAWVSEAKCGYCLETLLADQPGGRNVRHTDGTPYGQCRQAIRARTMTTNEEINT